MYIRPDHLEKWSGHGRTGRIGRAAPDPSNCVDIQVYEKSYILRSKLIWLEM